MKMRGSSFIALKCLGHNNLLYQNISLVGVSPVTCAVRPTRPMSKYCKYFGEYSERQTMIEVFYHTGDRIRSYFVTNHY